ncbi:MAG: phage portal protein [Alphaproteobacteria bacterium]|nr:phage portal protein [Alphaproteobacteria bacterium]
MGLINKIAARAGYYPKKEVLKHVKRTFNAAQLTRLTNNWTTQSTSINYDLQRSLKTLQARSRDLFQNDPFACNFLRMAKTNVVGPSGFTLQIKVKDDQAKGQPIKLDKLASDAIESHFDKWSKPGVCEVTGQCSFWDIQNLFMAGLLREGEVLMRKVYGKNANSYGFGIQVLDIDRLDVDYNTNLENGNEIRMGVELTSFGKPVAYHILAKHPGDNAYYSYRGKGYLRIPANEIIHKFVMDRPEQVRGIPALHAAMFRMQNLGAYEEAAIIASRIGAAKMGFYTTPDGDGSMLADSTESNGELRTEAEPGQFDVLPDGVSFTAFDPDYPHAMFGTFVKSCLRAIASGIGVSYNALANDLEGVNFSSMRSGALSERDNWMVWQDWVITHFLEPIFSEWLKMALLHGAITLPNGSALPLTKFEKFNVGKWQGRRWQWVDPRADTDANIQQISRGLKSRADAIAEQGGDIEDVFFQLAEEKKRAEELGISEILSDQNMLNMLNNQSVNQDTSI